MRARLLGTLLACLALPACTRKDSPNADARTSASAPAGGVSSVSSKQASPPPPWRLVGRFVEDPEGSRFAWSGSAMIARFEGTSIAIGLEDEGHGYYEVVVDGNDAEVLRTDPATQRYVLAEGLSAGEHEVLVERRTEAKVGEAVFLGFEAGPDGRLLPAPPAPERRIEIIGDSISTGYGNEGPGPKCTYARSQQNEYMTYAAIAARELHADHVTVAWSGKTIREMTEYFDKALPERDDRPWSFSAYQPQVVVLNVGTNDFATRDPGEARFVSHYQALVAKVRAAYPKAFLVCALGPMLTDIYPPRRHHLTKARRYMKLAVSQLKDAGDRNLDYLEFRELDHADGLGCGFHPGKTTHLKMSKRLVAFVKERMGW